MTLFLAQEPSETARRARTRVGRESEPTTIARRNSDDRVNVLVLAVAGHTLRAEKKTMSKGRTNAEPFAVCRGWTYRVVAGVTVHFRPDLRGAAKKRYRESSLRGTVRACGTRDALAGARDNSKKRSQSMSDSWQVVIDVSAGEHSGATSVLERRTASPSGLDRTGGKDDPVAGDRSFPPCGHSP